MEIPPTFGGKLSTTLGLFFENLPLFAGLALTVWLPVFLVTNLAFPNPAVDPATSLIMLPLTGLVEGVFGPLVNGAVIWVLAERVSGRRTSYRAALGVGFRQWGRLLAAHFVADLLISLGLIALIVPGIMLLIRYSLIDFVVVMEGAGVAESRSRSASMARGKSWGIFFVWAIYSVAMLVLNVLAEVVTAVFDSFWTGVVTDCATELIGLVLTSMLFMYYWEALGQSEAGDPMEIASARAARSSPCD